MRMLVPLGLLCALAHVAAPAAAQSLRTVPLDHWAYDVADELVLRRPELAQDLWLQARPWREADFARLVERVRAESLPARDPAAGLVRLLEGARFAADTLTAGGDITLRNELSARYEGHAAEDGATFEPPFLRPRFGDEDEDERGRTGRPPHRVFAQQDFGVQVRDLFVLGWRYVVDSHVKSDPTRTRQLEVRQGEDFGFTLLDAYTTVHLPHLYVTAGRNELSLGPGRGTSPLLSDSIPPLDQLRVEVGFRAVRFLGLVARRGSLPPHREVDELGHTVPGSLPPEGVRRDVNRHLYLHRVDWRPLPRLQVAITEAALVTGINRGLEIRYANLLAPFFLTQLDQDEPDGNNVNVIVEAEATALLPGAIRVYGLLLAQEFFVDRDKREEIGNQLAWRLGGAWGDPLGLRGVTAGLEYTRADVFTYLHRGLNTNWTTFGVPLGSSLGPDADQAMGWLSWRPWPELRLTVDALVRRGGERSIETLENVVEAGNPPFPSGIVQREMRGGVEGQVLLPRRGIEGVLRVSAWDVENVDNVSGADNRFLQLNVGLRYRWIYR